MWLSINAASSVFNLASIGLVVSAAILVVATGAVWWAGNIKEEYLKRDVAATQERAANAELRAAEANTHAEELKSENLLLQRAMLPRDLGNAAFARSDWDEKMGAFKGTALAIRVVDDREARNLARQLSIVATRWGWNPSYIADEKPSDTAYIDVQGGVKVTGIFRDSEKADESNPLTQATLLLKDFLNERDLGVGEHGVIFTALHQSNVAEMASRGGGWFAPRIDPSFVGVYVEIGGRPVAETVRWLEAKRLDAKNAKQQATAGK